MNAFRFLMILQISGNDLEKVKSHHLTLMRIMGTSTPDDAEATSNKGFISSANDESVTNGNLENKHSAIIYSRARSSSSNTETLPNSPVASRPASPLLESSKLQNVIPSGAENTNELPVTPSVLQHEERTGEDRDLVDDCEILTPILPEVDLEMPSVGADHEEFDLFSVVSAVQHNEQQQVIENYFGCFPSTTVSQKLNESIDGVPSIFFAVATNREWVVKTWANHGGDINAVHERSKIPLLAFAIMRAEAHQDDTTLMIATLLSFGADHNVIPGAFYQPLSQDLRDDFLVELGLNDFKDDKQKWCVSELRTTLSRTMNITQRCHLMRASTMKKQSTRYWQVAEEKNAKPLLGLPYFLVGQTQAISRLMNMLLSRLMIPSKRPLVLVFAGPSGHGKTELARKLGDLLSLDLQIVDCTIVSREMELFGGRAPLVNSAKGSPLNNFLAERAGRRCIVFLDEFEKTSPEIHQSLLLPFDNGTLLDI